MNNQKGQIILILILVMTVTLAIGLAIVQRSLVDVSTASRVEQSSRAFAAAEAGIEKSLQLNSDTSVNFSENSSMADAVNSGLYPPPATSPNRQKALELPFLAKEDIAQVWLADYTSNTNPPSAAYTQSSLDVYWGNSTTDRAALELTLVYWDGSKYAFSKWYLDQADRGNNFELVLDCGGHTVGLNTYQCKKTLDFSSFMNLNTRLMLLRTRLLYNTASQPLAVWAVGTCGSACSLPAQSRLIVATGKSGETQRRVKLFQLNNVIPPYFDYAIFAAGEISK